tara:strand:+ start:1901 stop:2503 length:603 start_codon:yes stop_codon:yes gene_type:complete
MINLDNFFLPKSIFLGQDISSPWSITANAEEIIHAFLSTLDQQYIINNGIAVHREATIEANAIIKPPVIIGPRCFVASFTYLRGGVYLESDVILGPSVEVKSSFIFRESKAAHFNFIGDSIIGDDVNIEAGAILANYRNELPKKEIVCYYQQQHIHTQTNKFGSLIGSNSKIGANAVLAPGTIIDSQSVVQRLELVDQLQ